MPEDIVLGYGLQGKKKKKNKQLNQAVVSWCQ